MVTETMGRRREKEGGRARSQTLPSSPSHSLSSSASSSDFEFTIAISPRKSSAALCPADELFYKGQLLPLHLSPRLSMVRTLLLSSSTSSSSSSGDSSTASRNSSGSSTDCDSSRPSSVADYDDELKRINNKHIYKHIDSSSYNSCMDTTTQIKKAKYFSLSRFSSVFRKEPKNKDLDTGSAPSVKRVGSSAKDVFKKYMKKVKPLYEKLSHKQQQQKAVTVKAMTTKTVTIATRIDSFTGGFSHSFSGNLRYPRKRNCVSSCPSSMRSSPNHSGVLSRTGLVGTSRPLVQNSESSTMEELQSAIQGAIAHCKNSMVPHKNLVSNEI